MSGKATTWDIPVQTIMADALARVAEARGVPVETLRPIDFDMVQVNGEWFGRIRLAPDDEPPEAEELTPDRPMPGPYGEALTP